MNLIDTPFPPNQATQLVIHDDFSSCCPVARDTNGMQRAERRQANGKDLDLIMTNTGPLSSAAVKHPLSLIHRPIPFDMASIIIPPAVSSSSRSHIYSMPNWTHLSSVDAPPAAASHQDEGTSNTTVEAVQAVVGRIHRSAGLAPTYSTPHEASLAYQAGLLKSDPNISVAIPPYDWHFVTL
jgi:hypothetical protein